MEDKVNTGSAASEVAESNPTPTKKVSKTKAKQQKLSRPPTSKMVITAIQELKDRKGSSVQAIKKYVVATYKVDADKIAPLIKKYLKNAVSTGVVVQTKGKGASGSFKLSTDKPKSKAKIQRVPKTETKKTKSVEKKTTTTRKSAAIKKTTKKVAEKSKKQPVQKKANTKATSEAKALSKAKKAVKAPAAKTKTPKPKKAATKTVKSVAKK